MIDKKLKYYAKKLNEDAPKGEFLAYINKKESNLLKRKGGLGIKTKSGIPSYIGSDASGQGGGSTGGGPGDASDSGSGNGGNGGNGGDGGDRHNPNRDSGYSTTSTPTKSKTPTSPTNIHNDDPNAPEAYEIIGGKKFDVTPDTIDEREKARVKQSILDAPIPNITDKGISFFKNGNLLTNSFMPGDNPLGKPKFSMGNFLLNAGMFAINPALAAKYRQAKSLYTGAKYATNILSDITGKNVSKPFQTVENLTKNIGLKDKNVIKSFKDSFTNNLTSKTKTKPVINTNTDNDNNGIASLEDANVLQDEYSILFQKLQTGNISDAERTRYTMLKNMLGI